VVVRHLESPITKGDTRAVAGGPDVTSRQPLGLLFLA